MKRTQKDFLNAVKKVDRRYFAEVADRIAAPERFAQAQKGNGRIMKQKRHFTEKYAWGGIGIAAALLLAGGVMAAMAMYGRPDDILQSSIQEFVQSSTPEVTEQDSIFALTDQTDTPGMRALAESETGYYYIETVSGTGADRYERYPNVHYLDKETGETVYLCARPNCLHDGNEFCTATTREYSILHDAGSQYFALVWLDGALYAAAEKTADHSVVLLRYEPDGTAVTEVQTLYEPAAEYDDLFLYGELIAHRGQLWYSIRQDIWIISDDSALGSANVKCMTGYRFGAFDVQKGLNTVLLSADGQREWFQKAAPAKLKGEGNFIYFSSDASWGEQNELTTGIWRTSCLTGKTEKVIDIDSLDYFDYYVNGDRVVWQKSRDSGMYYVMELCFYDLTAGELIYSVDAHRVFSETESNELFGQMNFGIRADKEHIVLLHESTSQGTQADNSDMTQEIAVFDWDGNAQSVTFEGASVSTYWDSTCMTDGALLLRTDQWYQLPITGALNGNAALLPICGNDYDKGESNGNEQ